MEGAPIVRELLFIFIGGVPIVGDFLAVSDGAFLL
jgi:hypothetical protein